MKDTASAHSASSSDAFASSLSAPAAAAEGSDSVDAVPAQERGVARREFRLVDTAPLDRSVRRREESVLLALVDDAAAPLSPVRRRTP